MRIHKVFLMSLMLCAYQQSYSYAGSSSVPSRWLEKSQKIDVQSVPSGSVGKTGSDTVDFLRQFALESAENMAKSFSDQKKKINNNQMFSIAKESVSRLLKDPSSAQFKNLRVVKKGSNSLVCGDVNAKNSYGGYVGFKAFISGVNDAYVEDNSGKYGDINSAMNAGIRFWCS